MSAGASGRDKRRHERMRLAEGKIVWNVSEGGVYIATEQPRRVGSVFVIKFRLAKSLPLVEAKVKVVRVLHRPNSITKEPAGMALKFETISEPDLANIRQYILQKKLEHDLG